jgi:ribonuclease-3
MDQSIDDLQARIGHSFRQPALLDRALTHRSFGADHNERLEFLGDAVLSLAVSSLLFERFAGSDEGDLTRVRAHLVREDSLHRMALQLGLPEVVRLSDGEARGGGAQPSWPMRSRP